MKRFVRQHAESIHGVLCGFDRIRLRAQTTPAGKVVYPAGNNDKHAAWFNLGNS